MGHFSRDLRPQLYLALTPAQWPLGRLLQRCELFHHGEASLTTEQTFNASLAFLELILPSHPLLVLQYCLHREYPLLCPRKLSHIPTAESSPRPWNPEVPMFSSAGLGVHRGEGEGVGRRPAHWTCGANPQLPASAWVGQAEQRGLVQTRERGPDCQMLVKPTGCGTATLRVGRMGSFVCHVHSFAY